MADLNKLQSNINKAHCSSLTEHFCNYNYVNARGMMTVYIFSTINPKVATYTTAVRNVYSMKLLKDGFRTVMINGHY